MIPFQVQIMGILDLACALWILLLMYFDLSLKITFILAGYLAVKFILFPSKTSFVDLISGIVMVFAAYNISGFLTYIFIIWLIQKGFFSFTTFINPNGG